MAKTGKNKKLVEKSAICIFAGRDSEEKNNELGRLLAFILNWADREPNSEFKALLDNYFFVFTDGTFNRIFVSRDFPPTRRGYFWDFWYGFYSTNALKNLTLNRFFNENCICMHGYRAGGIILFANMVVTQRCSIVWPFLDPHEAHCTRPENLALLRLCDVWKAKWLPNFKSVIEWILDESKTDAKRSDKIVIEDDPKLIISLTVHEGKEPQPLEGTPGSLKINKKTFNFRDFSKGKDPRSVEEKGEDVRTELIKMEESLNLTFLERKLNAPFPGTAGRKTQSNRNLALIAHDNMKPRMVEFVVEYKREIDGYVNGGSILTTQATGKEIEKNLLDTPFTRKIVPCLSGPLGGDIQIATAILLDRCDTVIFFIDPLNPHPHVDDIRVVLMAGMTNPNVRVLTNETAARAWAEALRKRGSSPI